MPDKTRRMVSAALMAAVLCVLSPLSIPVGPIPLTLGIFAVSLSAAVQPLWGGVVSLCVYILLGAVGLPVFSGFQAGPQVLLGPTGGYIAGYFLLTLGIALAMRYRRQYGWWLVGALLGLLSCYLLGTLWYTVVTGSSFWAGVAVCVLPFALPDMMKAALALVLAKLLRRRMERVGE